MLANFFSTRVVSVTHWNNLSDNMRELFSSLKSFKYKSKYMLLESESSGIIMDYQM